MVALYQNLYRMPKVEKINLADNQVADCGMDAITKLLSQNPSITSLNLASNMISGEGLEICLS